MSMYYRTYALYVVRSERMVVGAVGSRYDNVSTIMRTTAVPARGRKVSSRARFPPTTVPSRTRTRCVCGARDPGIVRVVVYRAVFPYDISLARMHPTDTSGPDRERPSPHMHMDMDM